MFHLKPRDELTFGNPTGDYTYLTDELLFIDNGFGISEGFNVAGTSSYSVEKKQKGSGLGTGVKEGELRKKAMHRDIERKRRQEMSQLYDTLRSLIPREQLKGKHSISDLMKEAMNYTKQLENNVRETRNQRDKLRGVLSTFPKNDSYVTVQLEQDGIEILINSTTCEFGLSRVMIELVAGELDVVNSISTKSDDHRFLHKILAQANDARFVDISMLQERLTQVVNISAG